MHQDIIRYRTRPEQAAANEELIRAVYEELGKTQPDGLSYATFLLRAGDVPAPGQDRAGAEPAAGGARLRRVPGGHRRPVRAASGPGTAAENHAVQNSSNADEPGQAR